MSRDEMTRLRDARPEPPIVSEAGRAKARERLFRSMESPARHSAFRDGLPQFTTVLPAAGVLITVVIAVFFVVSLGTSHRGGRSSAQPGAGAARGSILASSGQPLAVSEKRDSLTVDPSGLPPSSSARSVEARHAVELLYGSLPGKAAQGQCSASSPDDASQLACRILGVSASQGVTPLFASSQPVVIGAQTAQELTAQASQLPGLKISTEVVRAHPRGVTAAQVLGTTAPSGALAGESGLEFAYNRDLTAGETLRTSINLALQEAGERSLATSIKRNGSTTAGGAFVAMNPQNGQIYAMGSAARSGHGEPLVDQAITSAEPIGSTFKPITAIAALESGDWSANYRYDDTGEFCPSPRTCLHNSGDAAYGDLDLEQAITVSDDVFFYHLGDLLNANPVTSPNGGQLQKWARAFGIGQPSGIDLPGAATGTLPAPASNAHKAWSVGDNIDLSVGQGGLAVSPLQLAVTYAAVANGGAIVTPHVGEDLQNSDGTISHSIDPGTRRQLNINPSDLRTVFTGLRAAASRGTSSDVMRSFPEPVYGKTGTTQYIQHGAETDSAWYAAFVPATATSKPIVVIVWIPGSGFGDVAAAPVARQILSQWFSGQPGPYIAGSSTDQ